MNDKMNVQDQKNHENSKKTWQTPELTDYDYGSVTQGGVNLRTSDDVVGDNYRVS
ncbi:hypothetical protein [Terasakiella pusilla]|uniref:hypothetical protein n=2 Tax=Terasakiella pusilla TaxID=64973 RepID=UPI003AA82807